MRANLIKAMRGLSGPYDFENGAAGAPDGMPAPAAPAAEAAEPTADIKADATTASQRPAHAHAGRRPQAEITPAVMTYEQAGRYLGISALTLRRQLKHDEHLRKFVRAYKYSPRLTLFKRAQLDAYLASWDSAEDYFADTGRNARKPAMPPVPTGRRRHIRQDGEPIG